MELKNYGYLTFFNFFMVMIKKHVLKNKMLSVTFYLTIQNFFSQLCKKGESHNYLLILIL